MCLLTIRQCLLRHPHRLDHLFVIHARGSDDRDDALAVAPSILACHHRNARQQFVAVFVADAHHGVLGMLHLFKQLQQHGVVFEHLQHGHERLRLLEFRLLHQRGEPQSMRMTRVALLQAREHLADHHLRQRLAQRCHGFGIHLIAHFREALARKHLVQQVLCHRQIIGCNLLAEINLAIEHLAIFGHDDDHNPIRRHRDERHLTNVQRQR